jgi:hypothetical protein
MIYQRRPLRRGLLLLGGRVSFGLRCVSFGLFVRLRSLHLGGSQPRWHGFLVISRFLRRHGYVMLRRAPCQTGAATSRVSQISTPACSQVRSTRWAEQKCAGPFTEVAGRRNCQGYLREHVRLFTSLQHTAGRRVGPFTAANVGCDQGRKRTLLARI